jgi:hypothetical protein
LGYNIPEVISKVYYTSLYIEEETKIPDVSKIGYKITVLTENYSRAILITA